MSPLQAKPSQHFQPGDVVAFRKKDRDLSGAFTSILKFGIIAKCEKPGIDGLSRSSFIQTSGAKGEILEGEEVQRSCRFTVHRRNDQVILIERPGEFQEEFDQGGICEVHRLRVFGCSLRQLQHDNDEEA